MPIIDQKEENKTVDNQDKTKDHQIDFSKDNVTADKQNESSILNTPK